MLVSRLIDWYKGWSPRTESVQPLRLSSSISNPSLDLAQQYQQPTNSPSKRTSAALPPSFAEGLKALCKWSLSPSLSPSPSFPSSSASPSPSKIPLIPQTIQKMFGELEEPGLIHRYESVNCQRGVRAHRGARSRHARASGETRCWMC